MPVWQVWTCGCLSVWLSEASGLSASHMPWSVSWACDVTVPSYLPSTGALSLHQHSQCHSLWVIGLGARALYFSQSPSFIFTFNDYYTLTTCSSSWGSLPLPSRLHRLLACTPDPCPRSIHPSKTSTGFQGTDSTLNDLLRTLSSGDNGAHYPRIVENPDFGTVHWEPTVGCTGNLKAVREL